ncbi:uncharacterized protein A1O9_02545 [Exophiala aquamarina CBS 119918]|uniref:DUF1275 domain protein n=1 Tax=Exophiala aquamarina CBS 119918 TaxID=1182545 RepID=A0A072PM72_9EURO|nr:uncharacterized protein A1O9_02545 [Exophiala aquamarina CBS 119918]KEF60981.1 hypothetical protein A1O9_02545 [Exophiala aquamarina CBS 119918]
MPKCDLSSAEKGETDSPLHRVESSLTLTNSTLPTPQSSRDSSRERRKRSRSRSSMTVRIDLSGTLSMRVRTQSYLYDDFDCSYMSLIIIICFFISGLIDSVAFNSWNCFVQMQTGNTVFAALGLGGQPQASHDQQYYKSLTSIAAFCLGTLFFSALHRYPTGLSQQPTSRRRLIFLTSFLVQTIFITIAAVLVTESLVSNHPFETGTFSSGSVKNPAKIPNFLDLCPVAILAFQAAGQVTLSRLLAMLDLPTIVLSTLYHDFTADLYSLRVSWRQRTSLRNFFLGPQRRQATRLASIVSLFAGGIIGGETYKSRAGMAGALWIAAFLKLAVTIAWLFWRTQKSGGHDDGEQHDHGERTPQPSLPR